MAASGMSQHAEARGTAATAGHLLLHMGEMLVAMMVGMMVFGGLFGALLLAAGTTSTEVLETAPAVAAVVLMFNMTVPMVWWMRRRGQSEAHVREMTGAMVAVCAVTLVLLGAGAVTSTAICGVECALMVPAMGIVLVRRRHE